MLLFAHDAGHESVSLGTPAKGSLEGGVCMPLQGHGFVSYSRFQRRPAWVRHDERAHVDFRVVPTQDSAS